MNDAARWHRHNEAYLAAALDWLRQRLAWFAAGAAAGAQEDLAAARARMDQAAQAMSPPALVLLGDAFGLSAFERDVLLLCTAMALDTRMATHCARAQDDALRPYPTFGLALALFEDPAWDVCATERPLRYWRLVEVQQAGAPALTAGPLRADERIVHFVKGLNVLDERLAALLLPFDAEGTALSASQQQVVEEALGWLATGGSRLPVVQAAGGDAVSKHLVARQLAAALGARYYRLPADAIPADAGEAETFTRLWQREAVLLPALLFVDAHEAAETSRVGRFATGYGGRLVIGTREALPGMGAASVVLDVAKPTAAEQRAAWAGVLEEAGDLPDRLAGQFRLNLDAIMQIGQSVSRGDDDALAERLWQACRVRTRPRLEALAQRIDALATWDDLVLPPAELRALRMIAAQVPHRATVYDAWGFRQKMNRGLGVNALFAGESGTGKTMAAEVLAGHLALDLYRIDLSAVVSKYIGETEKNLRRLFDAAEDGGALLFFDEADALFGKRSQVKDAHDRYANIEINYLLQRIEAYRGIALLATNMKSALDQAFLRRLRFVVNFPFPGREERRQIWEKAFPADLPTEELDLDRLARLNLTGGSIHNVALNAAFMAAEEGRAVGMPLVLEAAHAEFRKLEQPVSEVDFRWTQPNGVTE